MDILESVIGKDIMTIIKNYCDNDEWYFLINETNYINGKWEFVDTSCIYWYIIKYDDAILLKTIQQYGCDWCKHITSNIEELKRYMECPILGWCRCPNFRLPIKNNEMT